VAAREVGFSLRELALRQPREAAIPICVCQTGAARGYHIMYLKVHPNFDRLRSDPRFVKLMRSIRLEP
jgi:hypothetical protein